MIRLNIDSLIREKEYKEKRRLSIVTIAKETGLAIITVRNLRNEDVSRVYISTLDTLIQYFALTEIGQLLEYVPGGKLLNEAQEPDCCLRSVPSRAHETPEPEMALVGMPEASALAGMTRAGLRTALINAGVNIVRINEKALAVSEEDLAAFIKSRGVNPGRGRPHGSKNKPKSGT